MACVTVLHTQMPARVEVAMADDDSVKQRARRYVPFNEPEYGDAPTRTRDCRQPTCWRRDLAISIWVLARECAGDALRLAQESGVTTVPCWSSETTSRRNLESTTCRCRKLSTSLHQARRDGRCRRRSRDGGCHRSRAAKEIGSLLVVDETATSSSIRRRPAAACQRRRSRYFKGQMRFRRSVRPVVFFVFMPALSVGTVAIALSRRLSDRRQFCRRSSWYDAAQLFPHLLPE